MKKGTDKVRITTQCGTGTITIEVSERKAAKMFEKPMTPYGTAIKAIQNANRRYEKDGDHFEYLSAVHFAMAQCSMEMYNSLRKAAIYY